MTDDKNQPLRPEPLAEDSLRNEKQERFLSKLLRVVFAAHASLTLLFFALGVLGMFVLPSLQMSVSLFNTAVMAFSAVMAFRSMKHSAAAAFKYAVLLFLFGFGSMGIYRAIFIPESSVVPDVSNFLLFGIPAVLTYYCARLSRERQPPNDGREVASA